MSTTSLKSRGLEAAAAFLERSGLTVVERTWRCDAGVIDLIALDGEALVLVDVKTKRGVSPSGDALSAAMRRRIDKIAAAYIEASDLRDIAWRCDQVTLLVIAEDRALLRHHRDLLAAGE